MTELPTHQLNDGTVLPGIGFGTFPMRGDQAVSATRSALEAGYRLLDTAAMYRNEREVGQALRDSGVDRSDVVVQSKLPVGPFGESKTVEKVEQAASRLGVEMIDIMLIHWPVPATRFQVKQWRGLVEARRQGLVKTIGVSNFSDRQLRAIIADTGVTPAVNQIQVNPVHGDASMRSANEQRGVLTEAYSPLGQRRPPFGAEPIVKAASAHEVSPAQVILRWHLQIGTVPLPKSSSADRQRTNLDLAFTLSDDEVAAISALDG